MVVISGTRIACSHGRIKSSPGTLHLIQKLENSRWIKLWKICESGMIACMNDGVSSVGLISVRSAIITSLNTSLNAGNAGSWLVTGASEIGCER